MLILETVRLSVRPTRIQSTVNLQSTFSIRKALNNEKVAQVSKRRLLLKTVPSCENMAKGEGQTAHINIL